MKHHSHNEQGLVSRGAQGDVDAFARLVEQYRGAVFGLAYHVVGNFDDAEDIAQEAFVQAYRKLATLRSKDRFGAWLREITLNLARSWLRREVRQKARNLATRPSSRIDDGSGVIEALSALPREQHAVLCLRYIAGYSNAEIAEFVGTPVETVRSRLRLAKQRLRKELAQMVEETLASKLPDMKFIDSVVAIVADLGKRLTKVAPEDLRELLALSDEELDRRYKANLSIGAAKMNMPPREGKAECEIAQLPSDVRELFQRGLYEFWLATIAKLLRHPPEYLEKFDEAAVEFGCYPKGVWEGQPYARFYRPRGGEKAFESVQLGLVDVEDSDSHVAWNLQRSEWERRPK